MQKFNIWHTPNFTFAENRDPTLEPAGRESHQLLSSLDQKTLLPYLPNSVYQETFSVKSSGERDDHGSQNAYHTSFSAQKGSGDLNASEVHTNRKFYTWCIPDAYNTCTWVCVCVYIYSIKPHSFPAALLVSGKLKNNLQKWHNALPNQWELQVLQHSSMATVMWENIFRLLPGGAVLCMSQFSKSIKVMQLLDQQMNTKGKKWQNRLREKHKGHEKRSSWKDWSEHSASQR